LLADTVNPSTVMLLVNAIYFKGLWRYPFNESYTRPGKFQVAPTHSVTVPFMTMEHDLYWSQSVELDSAILRLPYMVSTGQSCFVFGKSASRPGNFRALPQ
jgi:serpin B